MVAYAGVAGSEETIKIEVGLREPLLVPAVRGEARTLLLGPDRGRPVIPGLPLLCLSHAEAMAEKLRAALSRREPAIRDFYDIDRAAQRLGCAWEEPRFLALVRQKRDVPGNPAVDVTPPRLAALRSQRETALKPVLRSADLEAFDLDRAFGIVSSRRGCGGSRMITDVNSEDRLSQETRESGAPRGGRAPTGTGCSRPGRSLRSPRRGGRRRRGR